MNKAYHYQEQNVGKRNKNNYCIDITDFIKTLTFTKNKMHKTHMLLALASMNNEIEPVHPHKLEDTESCLSPTYHWIHCILRNNRFL